MYKLIFMVVISFLAFVGCNTNNEKTEVVVQEDFESATMFSVAPSKVAEDGLCMADTLSFLVGQPETALQAMNYPENTRILIEGNEPLVKDFDPTRLNLVLGGDRSIVFVYCG